MQFSEGLGFADTVVTSDRTLDLKEDGETLRLLMQFMHMRRYPELHDLPTSTILSLAYAAEKYKVHSAASVCSHVIM